MWGSNSHPQDQESHVVLTEPARLPRVLLFIELIRNASCPVPGNPEDLWIVSHEEVRKAERQLPVSWVLSLLRQ